MRQIAFDPPSTPLPDGVLHLKSLATVVVDLIYWKPAINPGTVGECVATVRIAASRIRLGSHVPSTLQGSGIGMGGTTDDGEGFGTRPSLRQGYRMAYENRRLDDADLKTRVDKGLDLLSGRGTSIPSPLLKISLTVCS